MQTFCLHYVGLFVYNNSVTITFMIEWATRRKLQYFGIIVAFFVIFFVIPFYIFIYEAPTCFDRIRNGNELGVDCGGSCRLLCSAEIGKPVSRWDPRVFKVSPGVYSAVAYLENPNVTGESLLAPYVFRLYDKQNILVAERSGTTFIPKGKTFAIFEGNIVTGERIPTRATFDFTRDLVWERNLLPEPELIVTNKALSKEETAPRVDATVKNNGLDRVINIELVAIISDATGNAIGASRTFIENLEKGESKQVVFTWPNPFETKAEVCGSPADVALVIDRSGSMNFLGDNPPQPLTDVKNAASFFVNQLNQNNQNNQATLISFANDATLDSPLSKDFSALGQSIDAITILKSGTQNTNIGDGIRKAREELLSERGRNGVSKFIVMLTDGVATRPSKAGDDKYPEEFALQTANQAKIDSIGLFTIGLGKDLNVEFLKDVASSSEEAYFAPTAKELNSIYKQIATKICKKRPAIIEILYRLYPSQYVI